jgi:hypothetical protein
VLEVKNVLVTMLRIKTFLCIIIVIIITIRTTTTIRIRTGTVIVINNNVRAFYDWMVATSSHSFFVGVL